MVKLMKVNRAKEEVKWLQEYIDLVEAYEADTIEKQIIKSYAYTTSVAEIVRNFENHATMLNGKIIEKDFVVSVITGKATDPLHKLIKSSYLSKIKNNKRIKLYE